MKKTAIYLAVIIGVLLMIPSNLRLGARGIRNNNPGNLKKTGVDWVGLSLVQDDGIFYQFATPEYGIRALARTLKTYSERYGINTVRGIVDRWAPPTENNTQAYIAHVASVLGVKPDQKINVRENLVPLTEAIIIHENGSNPYSMQTIINGVQLA